MNGVGSRRLKDDDRLRRRLAKKQRGHQSGQQHRAQDVRGTARGAMSGSAPVQIIALPRRQLRRQLLSRSRVAASRCLELIEKYERRAVGRIGALLRLVLASKLTHLRHEIATGRTAAMRPGIRCLSCTADSRSRLCSTATDPCSPTTARRTCHTSRAGNSDRRRSHRNRQSAAPQLSVAVSEPHCAPCDEQRSVACSGKQQKFGCPLAPQMPPSQPPQSKSCAIPRRSVACTSPHCSSCVTQYSASLSGAQPHTLPALQLPPSVQEPHDTVRAWPQLSAWGTSPQFFPSRTQNAAEFSGMQPQTFAVPVPPHVWPTGHAPQSSCPPQPSSIKPQLTPASGQAPASRQKRTGSDERRIPPIMAEPTREAGGVAARPEGQRLAKQ